MAKDDDDLTARPGEDPYELDWPDDAKDERAAERERARLAGETEPVSRPLTALIVGVGLTLLCILPVAVIGGQIGIFLAVAAPVALGGAVVAWPTGLLLDRLVRRMPTGVGEVAFLVMGGAIGYGLTWVGITLVNSVIYATPVEDDSFRSLASMFMLTATAVGFLGAYMLTDRLRVHRRQVWILGGLVAALVALSLLANLFGTGGS